MATPVVKTRPDIPPSNRIAQGSRHHASSDVAWISAFESCILLIAQYTTKAPTPKHSTNKSVELKPRSGTRACAPFSVQVHRSGSMRQCNMAKDLFDIS
jgi:hypothetical protein